LCWLTAACEADGPEQVFEIDGLTVDAYFTDPVCGGTLDYFSRRLRWLEEQTGLRTADSPLLFDWYREDVPDAICRSDLEGCARGGVMYGPLLVFSHELVHALLSQFGSSTKPWLEEGLARLLEENLREPPFEPTEPSLLLMIDDPADLDYSAAGTFVAYLERRYGLERLLDFYQAVDGADAVATREIFGEVFGVSWDNVEADYLANYDNTAPFGGLVCDAPVVGWVNSLRWEHRFTDGCVGERSVGPFDLPPAGTEPEPWFEDAVTLRINIPGPYRVETTGLSGTDIVSVRSCTATEAVALWTEAPASDYQWFDAGTFRVTLSASLDETPDVRVKLVRYPDLLDGG
jgi:hypothetical protein